MSKAFIIDGYLFHWDMGPQSRVAEPVIAHEPLSPYPAQKQSYSFVWNRPAQLQHAQVERKKRLGFKKSSGRNAG